MKYRNVDTGVIVESDSVLSGSWEPVEEKKTKVSFLYLIQYDGETTMKLLS